MDEDILQLVKAIGASFISPAETGRDANDANIVDGLFAIARSIQKLADVIAAQQARLSDPPSPGG